MSSPTLNLSRLIWANIRYKALSSAFNVILLAMGIAFILTLLHLDNQIDQRFTRDLKGIDLVVSGKGSPLQMILSNVFHLDIPTGNIPASEADKLAKNRMVKQAIPLALGDNYNGYRIVGTNKEYIEHYNGVLASGRLFTAPMEVVIGSEVAVHYKMTLNQEIVGAHGLVNSDDLHTDFPYTVVGILKPTGTVLDRLVITGIESVWHVHEHPDEDDPEEVAYKSEHPWNEITALLITYKTPLAAAQLPRLVNKSSSMQAASPAFEVARLNRLMGVGGDILSAFGAILIAFSAFGIFVTLYSSVKDREYDIVLLRVMGARRSRIFTFILLETIGLGVAGAIAGIALSQIFIKGAALWISMAKHITLEPDGVGHAELYALGAAIVISILAGIGPALTAHRINILEKLRQS